NLPAAEPPATRMRSSGVASVRKNDTRSAMAANAGFVGRSTLGGKRRVHSSDDELSSGVPSANAAPTTAISAARRVVRRVGEESRAAWHQNRTNPSTTNN